MAHGQTICRQCERVVMQCRCMEGHKNKTYVVCDECIKKEATDEPQFCNYCRDVTDTTESDCVKCGLSKPHKT